MRRRLLTANSARSKPMRLCLFQTYLFPGNAASLSHFAKRLKKLGLKVWLDVLEMDIGDSLLTEIDEGLSKSRFGIVVLSRGDAA
jgi:TIR domain